MAEKSTTVVARIVNIKSTEERSDLLVAAGARLNMMEISQNDGCLYSWSPIVLEHRAFRLNELHLQEGDAIEIIIRKTKAY